MSGSAVVLVGVLVTLGWWTRPSRGRRADGRPRVEAPDGVALFEMVGVLRLASAAGISPRAGLAIAVDAMPAHVAQPEREALEAGMAAADVLEALARRSGGSGLDAVALSMRYGLPLDPTLERVETDLLAALRRRSEVRVRQLPVKLLFPLVLCVLPAFALLAVVPVVVAAFRA